MTSRDRSSGHQAPGTWMLAMLLSAMLVLSSSCALTGRGFGLTNHQTAGDTSSAQGPSFDRASMSRSFQTTDIGGVELVVARDVANQEELGQARAYLKDEVARFQQGQYDDPAKTHGMEMPGSKALEGGYGRVRVSYSDLPNGGQVTYMAPDAELVQALHAWFERRQMGGS